jgi:hypothetical protein
MNDQSTGRDSSDTDQADDPKFIESEVRDGVEKELRRTDLSADDRQKYEDALAKLKEENPNNAPG